jgi:copper homeostasis protein
MNPLIEVCLDSVASCIAAAQGGADRVELCGNLFAGGTTPTAGEIKVARERIDLALHVMIRPRGGDFCYSDAEFAVMEHDVRVARELGADGIVIGILTEEGIVDTDRCRRLVDLAGDLNVTFHRAFDVAADPMEALEDVIAIGASRLLTSGQEPSVWEGAELIAELIEAAGDRLIVMPGCGISERNFDRIHQRLNAREYHVFAHRLVEGKMKHRPDHVFMGGELRPPEFQIAQTCPDRVATMIGAIR